MEAKYSFSVNLAPRFPAWNILSQPLPLLPGEILLLQGPCTLCNYHLLAVKYDAKHCANNVVSNKEKKGHSLPSTELQINNNAFSYTCMTNDLNTISKVKQNSKLPSVFSLSLSKAY